MESQDLRFGLVNTNPDRGANATGGGVDGTGGVGVTGGAVDGGVPSTREGGDSAGAVGEAGSVRAGDGPTPDRGVAGAAAGGEVGVAGAQKPTSVVRDGGGVRDASGIVCKVFSCFYLAKAKGSASSHCS